MPSQNDFSNERKAIATAFKAGFVLETDATKPRFPYRVENNPFNRPKDAAYGEFSIAGGDSAPGDIGGSMRRSVGVVYLRFFLPEDGGTEDFNLAAGKFAEVFDLKNFYLPNGILVFGCTGVATVGKDQASGMYQKNARVNFRRDTFQNVLISAPPSPPLSASNVKFDGAGNIFFFNPDSNAFEKWEPRGTGAQRHLEIIA